MTQAAKDKLILALDVDSVDGALDLFDRLRDRVGVFKIGMQLFTAAGPDIVRQIIAAGGRVFLDLKYHDIPNTVAAAAIEATRLGVSIFNIHASGGTEMMKRAMTAVRETAVREKLLPPKVIAVTLLTSVDERTLGEIGISRPPQNVVAGLAQLAADCGLDGVVASAREIEIIRSTVTRAGFIIVTPGIRPASDELDDQRRVLSAAGAIQAGADYIVVGRPILSSSNPADTAKRIVEEIESALPND
jgi:orotidine-5'-phosphate decarboxylase